MGVREKRSGGGGEREAERGRDRERDSERKREWRERQTDRQTSRKIWRKRDTERCRISSSCVREMETLI